MTDSLCPVCGHPKPEGLAHCSLECEERDPEPSPALDRYALDPKRFAPAPTWNEPMEGATDGIDD